MAPAALDSDQTIVNGHGSLSTAPTHGNFKESHSRGPAILQSLALPYPSNSVHFLRQLQAETGGVSVENEESPEQARLKLDIIVVGAGLGGIATAIALARRGHTVTILEQAAKIGEVGAGIQIPPNSGRLLRRWGVSKHLEQSAVQPENIKFRRWQDGSVIGYTDLGQAFKDSYAEPYHVVHRAHFHDALHRRAVELGVTLKLNSKVQEYDADGGAAVLEEGSILKADLIIAADGLKSAARAVIHPHMNHEPRSTGFAAYRATVDVARMKEDPDISWILEKPSLNIWIGEDRHVMTYTIAAGKSLNMVLSHADHTDPALWTQGSAVEDMKKEFTGWDPQLTKIISLIDKCLRWPLRTGTHLSSWTAPSSRLVILGDAAHAMLPYMSQGAAMAVEDGAALALALNRIHSPAELSFALRAFEKERIQRSGRMADASAVNGVIWHFPDGPEQRARDAAMRAEVEGRTFISSANQWSDPVTQHWAYGYDAEKAMEDAWERAVSELITSQSQCRGSVRLLRN